MSVAQNFYEIANMAVRIARMARSHAISHGELHNRIACVTHWPRGRLQQIYEGLTLT